MNFQEFSRIFPGNSQETPPRSPNQPQNRFNTAARVRHTDSIYMHLVVLI